MADGNIKMTEGAESQFRFSDIRFSTLMATSALGLSFISESAREVLQIIGDAAISGQIDDVVVGVAYLTAASALWAGAIKTMAWAADNIPNGSPEASSRAPGAKAAAAGWGQIFKAPVGLVRKGASFAADALGAVGGWGEERRQLKRMIAECDQMIIEKGSNADFYLVYEPGKKVTADQRTWRDKAKLDRFRKMMVQSGKPLIERHIHEVNGDCHIKEMVTAGGRPHSQDTASVRSWLSPRDSMAQMITQAWYLHGSPVPPAVAVASPEVQDRFGRSGRATRREFDREKGLDLIQAVSASPAVQPENFSCAVEVEFLAAPEGSPAAKSGYPYQLLVSSELGGKHAALGFITAAEAEALRPEFAKADVLVSEWGKPTMCRNEVHDWLMSVNSF